MPFCASCGHEVAAGARFCEECGAPVAVASASSELRKTVTVLFCDLTGSTALGESFDPEPLRALLARYFERMRGIVELHGGTVEKFIGDAVMAVFGIPRAHEDDAQRAVRAAAEMRDALPELCLQGRIGVTTGEVVTGTEERLATGDAVNVAARLEQAAAPGEVLLGEPTLALLRQAVEVEAIEPLALKGKSSPVAAFRLLRVLDAPDRRHDTAFVGRERESELLFEAWRSAVDRQRCELATVVGDAGVGKSRLVAELLASLDGASVVRGRCLPYGEGVGYWPVVEVLKQLELLPEEENAAEVVRSVLGESDAPASADELAWAFRKTLERAATEEPLVVVFDDIQWGEEPFLDLVEHVALFSSGVSLLVLGMARPELLDKRPSWPVTLRLEPLLEDEVAELLPETLDLGLRERIVHAAGGNPLFVHEMVAMAAETEGEVTVPPTLQALLAARLDQLERAERTVLERGAVEGEVFHRGSVQALAGAEQVMPRLAALVRKQLIRPDRAQLPGDDGFRFRHLLIRDAAYDALPKATRAELHAAFARWLEEHGQSLVELDEILGYHYDQACRYREELGLPPEPELVDAARARLRATGLHAFFGGDYGTAARAFTRALQLAGDEVDAIAGIHLSDALYWGGNGKEALDAISAFADHAAESGDRAALLCARLFEGMILTWREPEGATERLEALVAEAEPEFRAAADEYGLYVAARARGQVANMHGRLDDLAAAYDDVAEHASRIGLRFISAGWRVSARFHGTTPVPELLDWIGGLDPVERRNSYVRRRYAGALAMAGRIAEARTVLDSVLDDLRERGHSAGRASVDADVTMAVEELAGDLEAAAAAGEAGCRGLEEQGDRSVLSSFAPMLGRVLCRLGRLDEAEAWADKGRELGAEDDTLTQMTWRQAKALVAARRGRTGEAVRLAREAVDIARETDMLNGQGEAFFDLGEVLALANDPTGAAEAYAQALARYERKGNVISGARTQEKLIQLEASPA
jgi:class 3 adenylate cyclase/tetratricopeptide (TPR) repeat protein